MFDAQQLAQMVEQELKAEVQRQVQQAVSQTAWINDLETQIVKFVQDRITARFSNIGTLPDLVSTVENKIKEMFEQGFVPDLGSYVDDVKIQQTVDLAVEQFVQQTIDHLVVDAVWTAKIENLLAQRMADRVKATLKEIDINATLASVLMENKTAILQDLSENFHSKGIVDQSSNTQLTVMDGVVVIENDLVTRKLEVAHDATFKGDVLIKGSVGIQGRINVDNETWQELSKNVGQITYEQVKNDFAKDLLDTIVEQTKHGIDIDNITVGGRPLVSGNTLSAGITNSNLQTVGTLNELVVQGQAQINDTVNVMNKRVGVNTKEPDAALTVWDEEVALSVGKFSKNTAFVGTTRKQDLIIGTNRLPQITIGADGLTTIQKLRIGRNNISWATEVPGYAGTKGDIVFNTNLANGTPFAWVCLGEFRWQALRTA